MAIQYGDATLGTVLGDSVPSSCLCLDFETMAACRHCWNMVGLWEEGGVYQYGVCSRNPEHLQLHGLIPRVQRLLQCGVDPNIPPYCELWVERPTAIGRHAAQRALKLPATADNTKKVVRWLRAILEPDHWEIQQTLNKLERYWDWHTFRNLCTQYYSTTIHASQAQLVALQEFYKIISVYYL